MLSGFWNITVYGRKHCYRLYTKHFNEAVHWACAIQKIIDTKAPVETPTQLLIRDIEVGVQMFPLRRSRPLVEADVSNVPDLAPDLISNLS